MMRPILILAIVLICVCRAQKRTCNVRTLENHFKPFVGHFGYKDHRWPENNNQMTEHCKSLPKLKKLAHNYITVCLKGMAKSIVSVLIFATERLNRLYCKNPLERANYIEMGRCGNQAKRDTTVCWNNLITLLSHIKNEEQQNKIPYLCCSFFEWKGCTMNAYRKVGDPNCKEQNVDNLEAFIDKMVLDALRLLCSDYEDGDRCDKIYPKMNRKPTKDNYKTPFQPGIEILESL